MGQTNQRYAFGPPSKSRRRDSSQTKPDIEKMKDTKKSCLGLYMCAFEKNPISDYSNHTFVTFNGQKTCFSRITFFSENFYRIFFRNLKSSFQCAFFGTNNIEIECQVFEIWRCKVWWLGCFQLYTTKSEFPRFKFWSSGGLPPICNTI